MHQCVTGIDFHRVRTGDLVRRIVMLKERFAHGHRIEHGLGWIENVVAVDSPLLILEPERCLIRTNERLNVGEIVVDVLPREKEEFELLQTRQFNAKNLLPAVPIDQIGHADHFQIGQQRRQRKKLLQLEDVHAIVFERQRAQLPVAARQHLVRVIPKDVFDNERLQISTSFQYGAVLFEGDAIGDAQVLDVALCGPDEVVDLEAPDAKCEVSKTRLFEHR